MSDVTEEIAEQIRNGTPQQAAFIKLKLAAISLSKLQFTPQTDAYIDAAIELFRAGVIHDTMTGFFDLPPEERYHASMVAPPLLVQAYAMKEQELEVAAIAALNDNEGQDVA